MTAGIDVPVQELIALRQYVAKRTPVKGRAKRVGNHLSAIRGRGMDFAEVRNYQAGDEVRHMEWRMTARTGRPHVKLYQEERERPIMLAVDLGASMFFGTKVAFKSVVASRLAALIAWSSIQDGDRVGALIASPFEHHEWMPRARDLAVLPILSALSQSTKHRPSSCAPSQSGVFCDLLMRLSRVTPKGSTVVLISDFYGLNEAANMLLRRLVSHNSVIAYHVLDHLEQKPPKPECYAFTNIEQDLVLDLKNKETFNAYQAMCDKRNQGIRAMFSQLGIQYTAVTSTDDLPFVVRTTFPRRQHG